MKLIELFPPVGIPRSGYPERTTEAWCGTDNEENARNNRESGFRSNVVYTYNSLGYRCEEINPSATPSVLTVGCSYTFGVGVAQLETYGERFTKILESQLGRPVPHWNLGVPGASNDYIARIIHQTLDILKPSVVLIMFTHLSRREYLTAECKRLHYNYSTSRVVGDVATKEAYAHLDLLSSEYDDQLNFFRNFRSISCLLKGRLWYFMVRKRDEISQHVLPVGNDREVIGFRYLDKARDGLHFGPATHREICDRFWQKFDDDGGLQTVHNSLTSETPGGTLPDGLAQVTHNNYRNDG